MLKNASSLAIVGLDTAENGPSKVRQVTNRIDAIIGFGRAPSAALAAGCGLHREGAEHPGRPPGFGRRFRREVDVLRVRTRRSRLPKFSSELSLADVRLIWLV